MFFSESDVTEFIEDNDVKFIRLTFCDTLGAMKNIAILPRELPRAIAYGIPFNATGLLEEQHQNLLLKPECTTLSVLRQSCPVLLQSDDHGRQAVCRGLAAKSP